MKYLKPRIPHPYYELIRGLGISQGDLALNLNISQPGLSKMLTGLCAMPAKYEAEISELLTALGALDKQPKRKRVK